MTWIIARLREPSTYVGLGVIATALGVSQDQWAAIAAAIAGIAGVVAVFLPERGEA